MIASCKSKMGKGRLTIEVIHRYPQGARNRPPVSKANCGGVFQAAVGTAIGWNKRKDPKGSFLQSNIVAKEYYFLAAGFAAEASGAAFAFGLTGAGVTGTTFSAVR